MILPNKHAENCAKFVKIFLDRGFYGVDEMESNLIVTLLCYAKKLDILTVRKPKKWVGLESDAWKRICSVSDLDLTERELSAIIDMYQEVSEDTASGKVNFMEETTKFIVQEFKK